MAKKKRKLSASALQKKYEALSGNVVEDGNVFDDGGNFVARYSQTLAKNYIELAKVEDKDE